MIYVTERSTGAVRLSNLRSDGTSLCARYLAQEPKGKTVEQWLAEKSDAFWEKA